MSTPIPATQRNKRFAVQERGRGALIIEDDGQVRYLQKRSSLKIQIEVKEIKGFTQVRFPDLLDELCEKGIGSALLNLKVLAGNMTRNYGKIITPCPCTKRVAPCKSTSTIEKNTALY
ncbi:hypothetical protein CWE09_11330 [Aliidiomarina minuta]|uniref:Uncharacterized protein n=1 Tax=Aliidiomarina minuta TaxID=880057 RepID=A0A432W4W6_9GAMM|nr:hypothetical protein CWE09_11330 [Aliidiomarina minuta]